MSATVSAYKKETPWVTPYIMLKNIDHALSLYLNGFGFTTKDLVRGDDELIWHAELSYQGQLLMFGKVGAYGMTDSAKPPIMNQILSPISLYLYTDDVDSRYEQAIRNGAKSIKRPEKAFWGDRVCVVEDQDHYQWTFATRIEES